MRELDEEEEKAGAELLTGMMNRFIGEDMSDYTVARIDEAITFHREAYKKRGLKFPHMVALVFPLIGKFDVVRIEQDVKGIETIIVNLTKKYSGIPATDIAFAVGRAWPDYIKRANMAHEWAKTVEKAKPKNKPLMLSDLGR